MTHTFLLYIWNIKIREANVTKISYSVVLSQIDIQDVGLSIMWDTGGKRRVDESHIVSVTRGHQPCLFWVICCCLCFRELNGLVHREETNVAWNGRQDWTEKLKWMLCFSPFHASFHVVSLQTWEVNTSLCFLVYVIFDELERCFAFCTSKVLIFLYLLTYIERFYNNLTSSLFCLIIFLGGLYLFI